MLNLTRVMRCASPQGLYRFCQLAEVLTPAFDSDAFALEQPVDLKETLAAIRRDEPQRYHHIDQMAERVVRMADGVGQQLLAHQIQGALQGNPYDKVIDLMLTQPALLERAERHRFASGYRYGRMWDSYQLTPAVDPVDPAPLEAFSVALSRACQHQAFRIESFTYPRINHRGESHQVLHVAIFREGLPKVINELNSDQALHTRVIRPAREYALTHEWHTGIIEVVANLRDIRDLISTLYARTVLGLTDIPQRITPQRLGLELFRHKPLFDFDLRDGITAVHVTGLNLTSTKNGLTMELAVPPKLLLEQDIYDVSQDSQAACHIESAADWHIMGATLHIQKGLAGSVRKREQIEVRIKHPNSHNLRELTPKDRRIVQRMLVDTGIMDEASIG